MDPQAKGYSLGGQGSGDQPLTATEIRDKRLEKLSAASAGTAISPTPNAEAAAAVPPPTPVVVVPGTPPPAERNASGGSDDDDDEVMDDDDLQAALAMSMEKAPPPPPDSPMKDASTDDAAVATATSAVVNLQTRLTPDTDSLDISEFHNIMWDSKVTTDNDKDRWVGQGVCVRADDDGDDDAPGQIVVPPESRLALIGSNHLPWGLTQAHGGPCGVMAAVQAELLRILLFGSKGDSLSYPTVLLDDDEQKQESSVSPLQPIRQGLAMAIGIIVARAALMPDASNGNELDHEAKIVLPASIVKDDAGLVWKDLEPWSSTEATVKSDTFVVHTLTGEDTNAKRQRMNGSRSSSPVPPARQDRILSLAHSIAQFLQEPNILECFQKPGGVILLVMSLVASRGGKTISQDMDDDTCKLTSQFGHCSQELINLLLTGQAVSNVFDNTMTPSGSLTCRGIQQRPAVGYLTQLESLRYCEVGGYYKNPLFPIWVVGSTSHFTVLFGDGSCLKESKSDALLEKCRRAFKEVDGVENGFISRIDLPKVYSILELNVGSEHAVQTLAASLEVSGADIILWDDFWKATSRLMTGATIEAVLQGDDEAGGPPPLLRITDGGDPPAAAAAAAGPPKPETDEEMAQRLAQEWGSSADEPSDWNSAVASVPQFPAAAAAAAVADSGPMSDEEYARKLQAQFDSEGGSGGGSVTAVAGDDNATQQALADDVTTATIEEDEKMPDVSHEVVDLTGGGPMSAASKSPDFEKFGDTFSLYHYNGLRGGTLTPFRVTRLTAEEAVGASIALGASGGAGGAAAGGDLEDVVRTKWPSCMMNWLGKSPPYID